MRNAKNGPSALGRQIPANANKGSFSPFNPNQNFVLRQLLDQVARSTPKIG